MNKPANYRWYYKMKYYFFILSLIAFVPCNGQDGFTGTWQMEYVANENHSPISIELQIGTPEKNQLYPALMRLRCDSFLAAYQVLLVKKNARQLGISRTKYPQSESPFSLGNWTAMLNGTFDLSRDLKGVSMLTINRIEAKKYGLPMPDASGYEDAHAGTAIRLRDFLQTAPVQLKKLNDEAWDSEAATEMLQPQRSPAYFGLIDTMHVQTRDGLISFGNNKDNDIVSVLLNSKYVADQVDSKKKRPAEEILLDTGLNLIAFFADDFGKNHPSGASIELAFDKKKKLLDFDSKDNLAASFIVAKIYLDNKEAKENSFQSYAPGANNNPVNYYTNPGTKQTPDTSLQRATKVVANIVATSRQITLALWDDAVEDGDSISLSINGKWIAQGFPVKKQPQFILSFLKKLTL